jgi:hypothetical protein
MSRRKNFQVTLRATALCLAATLCCPPTARTAEIAAIVEYVDGGATSVAPMDLLEEGRVIELAANARLVLGYLHSCVRETIIGGRVTVGAEKSKVEGGTRQAKEVDCDGGRIIRSGNRSSDVAGAVFRKGKSKTPPLPKPDVTLFGISPLIRLSAPSEKIQIQRLDKSGEKQIDVPVSGSLVDTAKTGLRLAPGGLYAISSGATAFIVKVSPLAEKNAPLLSRLIPM